MSLASSTGKISGTPTAGGTYTVMVTATDGFGLHDSTTFLWYVQVLPLHISTPAAQTTDLGYTVSLQLVAGDGVPPYTWSASGLPAGLVIGSTGKITGKPTAVGTNTVVVTVIDTYGTVAGTAGFTWAVVALPTVTAPAGVLYNSLGDVISRQATVTGGTTPYSWTATGLPPGLTISSTGLIAGTLSTAGSFSTVVTVTDQAGATDTSAVTWRVLGITSSTAQRTNTVNQVITNFIPTVTGGSGVYTWSRTGLPTGLVFRATDGRMSGTPTVKGTYTVVLTVTDTTSLVTESATFVWKIQ